MLTPDAADDRLGIYGIDGEPQFFREPGMDRFVAVILNLASELWVHEERLRSLENGTATPDLDAAARAFIDRIFAPLREPSATRG